MIDRDNTFGYSRTETGLLQEMKYKNEIDELILSLPDQDEDYNVYCVHTHRLARLQGNRASLRRRSLPSQL